MSGASNSQCCAVLLCLLLGACGGDFAGEATQINKSKRGALFYDKVCIEGVTYLIGYRWGSVQLDKEGKVIPCK